MPPSSSISASPRDMYGQNSEDSEKRERRHRSESSPDWRDSAGSCRHNPNSRNRPTSVLTDSFISSLPLRVPDGEKASGKHFFASGSSWSASTGENTLTLRRREANRLAAQRFRSRKKGYQDSLEDKVRQLEEDKEGLARRLGAALSVPSHRRSELAGYDSSRYASVWTSEYPSVGSPPGPSPDRAGINLQRAGSDRRDGSSDSDVRFAALEFANRRLQDKLRDVCEENERLREEIRQLRDKDQDQREAQAWTKQSLGDREYTRISLSPFDPSSTGRCVSESSLGHSALTFSPLPPPPPHPSSPPVRLPPIRLAPIQPTTSDARSLPSPMSLTSDQHLKNNPKRQTISSDELDS